MTQPFNFKGIKPLDPAPASPQGPKIVVFDTSDIVQEFKETVDQRLWDKDGPEMVAQAVHWLFNDTDANRNQLHFNLDLNRMRSNQLFKDSDVRDVATNAARKFARQLHEVVQVQGAFSPDGSFPYVYERLIADDLVVRHLPH